MDFIKQVIINFKTDLFVGVLGIIIGIIVPTFRLYWLIAGVNTTPKEQLQKMDLKYVGKYFGIFISRLGIILILIPFVFSYFELKSYIKYMQPIIVISVVGTMFVFGRIKKKKIYKSDINKK